MMALMLDRAPPHLQGMAVGGFHFAFTVGMMFTVPLFGSIAERLGYHPMWWAAASISILGIGIYLGLGRLGGHFQPRSAKA